MLVEAKQVYYINLSLLLMRYRVSSPIISKGKENQNDHYKGITYGTLCRVRFVVKSVCSSKAQRFLSNVVIVNYLIAVLCQLPVCSLMNFIFRIRSTFHQKMSCTETMLQVCFLHIFLLLGYVKECMQICQNHREFVLVCIC